MGKKFSLEGFDRASSKWVEVWSGDNKWSLLAQVYVVKRSPRYSTIRVTWEG